MFTLLMQSIEILFMLLLNRHLTYFDIFELFDVVCEAVKQQVQI